MSTSTVTSSEHPSGTHKRRVRNLLLDSRFQLKYAGFLVLVAVVISCVVGAVLYSTTLSMIHESSKVVEESRSAAQESRNVSAVSRMNVHDLALDAPDLVTEFNREADAYDNAMAAHEKVVIAQQESLVRRQRWMLGSLVAALAVMVVLIGLLGIYFTHKVAGPVFKMTRLLAQVGSGNLRVEARLRRGDELKAFFDTFTQMVSGLRDFERRQLADVEAAVSALERGNKQDAADAIQRVEKAIRAAIEQR
jgi:nitrogen fixation/metabolism regulation signal transduction histidine kinase